MFKSGAGLLVVFLLIAGMARAEDKEREPSAILPFQGPQSPLDNQSSDFRHRFIRLFRLPLPALNDLAIEAMLSPSSIRFKMLSLCFSKREVLPLFAGFLGLSLPSEVSYAPAG
jgi:hypothetical protein